MDIKITTVRAFEDTKQVTRESILVSTKSEATQNGQAHAPSLAPLSFAKESEQLLIEAKTRLFV